MTDYEVSTSLDGKKFERVVRRKEKSPVALVVSFPPRKARFVRITSFDSERKQYPTTFREIEINGQRAKPANSSLAWPRERGVRALGALGGKGATAAIIGDARSIACDGARAPADGARGHPRRRDGCARPRGATGSSACSKTRCGRAARPRHSAMSATGARSDRCWTAYARFAKRLDEKYPARSPGRRQHEVPVRGPDAGDALLDRPRAVPAAAGRSARPRAAARAGAADHGESAGRSRHVHALSAGGRPSADAALLEAAGLRQEAAEQAFARLGPAAPRSRIREPAYVWPKFDARRISPWLPCVCTEREDLPRLLPLLQHTNGWVRINAAKAIALARRPARHRADRRRSWPTAKSEADYGWSKTWKDEEFNDPCPRWREALVRALGLLKATQHVGLIAKILDDERSVLEVRHAAAEALADIGSDEALAVLRRAATAHPFGTVRQVARDALLARGIDAASRADEPTVAASRSRAPSDAARDSPASSAANFDALLFIKGDNDLPNTPQTVEQADRWRQTYVVTDEGPVLPARRQPLRAAPAAARRQGHAADALQGRLGRRAGAFVGRDAGDLHAAREGQPWWHVWRINVDGTGLGQLTHGPYHHVGPAFLPDGRIVFASSRSGIRDEYHGYPCTALYVMNADGSDLHPSPRTSAATTSRRCCPTGGSSSAGWRSSTRATRPS